MQIKESVFEITELSSQIETILEKVEILTEDIADLRLDKFDLTEEIGRNCMRKELKILRVKSDVLQEYVMEAYKTSGRLVVLSEDTYNTVANLKI
ncbi:MAG: hypothetical protein E7406_09235 [Ruminococcaceae bacterium]|nr:hypothetical protein [Oscillospiraceae bacterium]